jgi:DNA-binding NarL/FixJ family response regulator
LERPENCTNLAFRSYFPTESRQLSRPVRVLIADDHLLFAEALSTILEPDQRINVVGRAANGEEAVKLAGKLKPDVVLMDISMPVLDGIEAARQIHEKLPNAQVLMLTGSAARQDIAKSRKAGASGYVTKDRIAAELVDAILALNHK